jgi:hypothetical protein
MAIRHVCDSCGKELLEPLSLVGGMNTAVASGRFNVGCSFASGSVTASESPSFASRVEIHAADWYALSARRADRLLRDELFDRVSAVRARAFARNYRNAEPA